jgi:hypothetical protein
MPKISELTAATAITGSDTLAIVQSGDTKKIAASAVLQPFDIRHYGGGEAGLLAAIAAAEAAGGTVVGGPETITVTAPIVMNCSCDLGNVTLNANGASVSPVLRLGTTSGAPTENLRCVLPTVRNTARTAGTWGAGIGVQCVNLYSSDINIGDVREFETGVSLGGANSGFAYNVVRFRGRIYDNKINLRLQPTATGGWCNQNTFIGGRLGFTTGVFSTSGYTGTRQVQLAAQPGYTVGGPNTNTFIGMSMEDNSSAVPEYIIEFLRSANYNQFINCRYEGASDAVHLAPDAASAVTSNFIIGGYQAFELGFTVSGAGTALYNSILSGRRNTLDSDGHVLNLRNTSSSTVTGPHLQGFAAGTSPLGKTNASTDWRYRLYASGLAGKQAADTDPRIVVDLESGRVDFGGGSAATDVRLTRTAANQLSMADGDAFRVQGTWDGGMLILGTYRLWVDSTGDLRIKDGAPASDTDGTIVGTQS